MDDVGRRRASASEGRRRKKRTRTRDSDAFVDFTELAERDARLASHASWETLEDGTRRATIDFTSWEATRALTGAILAVRHGARGWDVPEGHLVPTTTNRRRYVEWIERLLAVSAPEGVKGGEGVVGLDVGTGASVIYPLIGASTRGWRFVGTDVTDEALRSARENVERNPHLEALIEIRDARDENGGRANVFRGVVREGETFAFSMCNPPFFESMEEAGKNPNTACGGTEIEMVCEGGEEAFVKRMFNESLEMKHAVHWFTTMCGKKSTMTKMRALFHVLRVPAIRTTELVHGKTSRWCIAWSWSKEAAANANVPLPDPERLAKVAKFVREQTASTK